MAKKEETPKDITPIKRKGIEMAVKGLSKTYPFVIGYKDDDSDQYESAHYIDLLIDLDGLANYMGVEVNPYWSNELSKDSRYNKIYAIWSYLNFPLKLITLRTSQHIPDTFLVKTSLNYLEPYTNTYPNNISYTTTLNHHLIIKYMYTLSD